MNTKITCKKIASLLYLTDDEINSQETLLLSKHLESCSSCKNAREDFLATRKIVLQLDKGVPVYHEFIKSTEILIKSGTVPNLVKPAYPGKPFWHNAVSIIRHASSIAAVFLLFLLVWEQTVSVRKIAMLENRIQSTINPSTLGLIDRITLARSVFTDKEWNNLAISVNAKPTALDPHGLLQIRLILEKQILSEKTNELTLINFFRNSSIETRNAVTFKNLIK